MGTANTGSQRTIPTGPINGTHVSQSAAEWERTFGSPVKAASRSYRYLGNKSRIADWITHQISQRVEIGARVADPMCGTASVALTLSDAGYVVTAADELTFPVLHARARLLPTARCVFKPFAKDYADAVFELNSSKPTPGLFFREYSNEGSPTNGSRPRAYFTGDNAAKIDGMRKLLVEWTTMGADQAAVDLLLHDLVLAVNAYANIAGTYGYYRSSWNKKSQDHLVVSMSTPVMGGEHHTVMQGKLEDIAPSINVDACYLDPPYTKRQYGGNYHIPETIARQAARAGPWSELSKSLM